MRRNRAIRRSGFTLIEALVSVAVIALSASALLLAVQTTLQTQTDAMEQTIAMGLARQLIDEVLGQRYHSPDSSPTAWPLAPSADEARRNRRAWFDETGDYNGYARQGAVDMWDVPLGQGDGNGRLRHRKLRVPSSLLSKFREEIEVYYVDDSDPSVRLAPGQTSHHRAVEVCIRRVNTDGSATELIRLRQVFAYVPPPS